jgi:hypothetical protein
MIIDKFVKIKIGGRNIKHFKNINPEYKIYQEIEIPIESLTEGSNVKINCICDSCGKKRYISYQKYRESEKLYSGYFCQSCSHIKRKITNIERYGSENFTETKLFKDKCIISINNKYGCDNVFQNEVIKSKIKSTNLIKYGYENVSQNSDIQKKKVKSSYKEYNFEHLSYQGSYEKDFIDRYYDKIEISKIDSINYYLDRNRIYFPDFFIKRLNLIVEIKSSYTYELHKEKNIAKMNRCKELGYNFLFIIDKDYSKFDLLIKEYLI